MKLRLLGAALVTVFVQGCVIHVNDDDWDSGYSDSSYHDNWQERQRYNRRTIAQLQIGDYMDDVLAQLGDPDFSDAFAADGVDVRVLRYRVRHEHSDGVTTEDETTPLVFENGQLTGWGESAFQRVMGGHTLTRDVDGESAQSDPMRS